MENVGKNSQLHKAKKEKNDEFYTQYHDIEKEMNAYLEYDANTFRGKTVLLPCDDPEWSNFTKYFAQNFTRLGLKKLISTGYAIGGGKIFTVDVDINGDGVIDIDDLKWEYLEGDGDFRSDEVKKLRSEADIIVTNPPFSLFREFIDWIIGAPKQIKFSLVSNLNSVICKNIFPLIQDNKMWIGFTIGAGCVEFQVPDDYPLNSKRSRIDKDGKRYITVSNIYWFTNIEHGRRHQWLKLKSMDENKSYNKTLNKSVAYTKYDNYDAIEIPLTNAIPNDYEGIMGVPISFLTKYNPEQFEILGISQRGCHNLVPDIKKYNGYVEMRQNGEKTGSSGVKTNENPNLAINDGKKNYFINKDGHIVQSLYSRIFIRHKK